MIHHPPPPITHAEAIMVAEAVISTVAWDNASPRWRVDRCTRRTPRNWSCIGRIDLHNEDGTHTAYTLRLKVFGDLNNELQSVRSGATTPTAHVPCNRYQPRC